MKLEDITTLAAEGGFASARRRQLNRCLSLAALQEDVGLYVPVSSPPAGPAPGAPLKWQHGNIFHASAVCAAALDTATLPYRLFSRPPAPQVPSAIGAADMGELLRLLTRSASSACVGSLFASLPAPSVESAHKIQEAGDARTGHRSQGSLRPLSSMLSLSEGHGSPSGPELMAESVVLRGGRGASDSPATSDEASEALDAWLLQEKQQLRALRHRTVALQPLPVPLPFPGIFSPSVSQWGHFSNRSPDCLGGRQNAVKSAPVLTRLQHSGASRYSRPLSSSLSAQAFR